MLFCKDSFLENCFCCNKNNEIKYNQVIKDLIVLFINGFDLNEEFIDKYFNYIDDFLDYLENINNPETEEILLDICFVDSVKEIITKTNSQKIIPSTENLF